MLEWAVTGGRIRLRAVVGMVAAAVVMMMVGEGKVYV